MARVGCFIGQEFTVYPSRKDLGGRGRKGGLYRYIERTCRCGKIGGPVSGVWPWIRVRSLGGEL
jgi:hypothetical protein